MVALPKELLRKKLEEINNGEDGGMIDMFFPAKFEDIFETIDIGDRKGVSIFNHAQTYAKEHPAMELNAVVQVSVPVSKLTSVRLGRTWIDDYLEGDNCVYEGRLYPDDIKRVMTLDGGLLYRSSNS